MIKTLITFGSIKEAQAFIDNHINKGQEIERDGAKIIVAQYMLGFLEGYDVESVDEDVADLKLN